MESRLNGSSQSAPAIMPGSGTPITQRGRSVAYLPPPWHMRGRTLAMWFRLQDPDEARRHVPAMFEMEEDPVVGARFWDLVYDGVPSDPPGGRGQRRFVESVISFPVRYGDVQGDYPAHMYADDWVYLTAGREIMGWNLHGGEVDYDPEPAELGAGVSIGARLSTDGALIKEARLTLTGEKPEVDNTRMPTWLTTKIVTDPTGPTAQVGQLLATGPSRIDGRTAWQATAELSFGESPHTELHYLAPREIVDAQYWADVDLTVGWATVLEELGDSVWDFG